MASNFPGASLIPLLRRLAEGSLTSDRLRSALRASLLRSEVHSKDQLLRIGSGHLRGPTVIVRGWAARCRLLPDGRRQIFNFLVPGDILAMEPSNSAGDSIVTLTVVETVELHQVCVVADSAVVTKSLLAACDAEAEAQASLLFDHIVRLGQHNGRERMLDLFFELHRRLSAVGLGEADGFALPLKQEHLAESLGLTLVHTNRTLQKLRLSGFLHFEAGRIRLNRRPASYPAVVDQLAHVSH